MNWHGRCFGESMSSILSNPNIDVLDKLIQVTEVNQIRHAENMANLYVPGAKATVLSSDFKTQFNELLAAGDYEAIKNLEVKTEASENAISLEREMGGMKRNSTDQQVLYKLLSTSLQQLDMAITGNT